MNTPTTPAPKQPSAWRQTGVALILLGGGFVLGAASLAFAHGDMPGAGGWHHGPRIGMIQHVVRGALENVGATTAQEDKIHDIIAATYVEVDKGGADRQAMRKQVLELMKAPSLDRAAIEKLRADKIAEIDGKSKKIVGALLDAAGQLSAEQRAKLVQHVEARMDHGWGWRGRGHDGPEHDGDHGRDDHGDHG